MSPNQIYPPVGFEYLATYEYVFFPDHFVSHPLNSIDALRHTIDITYAEQNIWQRFKICMQYKTADEKASLLTRVSGIAFIILAIIVGIICLV